jgi:hypothetical protein
MEMSDKPEFFIKAADIVQKYAARMEINPNVPMTAAACTAQLYSLLNV